MPSKEVNELLYQIQTLESKIKEWPQRNSQSNPSAMMDLRDMRRELRDLRVQLVEAIQKDQN